jgi:CBS-domain-containing membrane protein
MRGPAGPAPTVVDVMLSVPKTLPRTATAAQVRAELADEHVHLVLLTEGARLVGTIGRGDLPQGAAPDAPASAHATLAGRTVPAATPAADAFARLVASGERRLAVVGPAGELLGLLCLNRRRTGFCSDADVAARAADRER